MSPTLNADADTHKRQSDVLYHTSQRCVEHGGRSSKNHLSNVPEELHSSVMDEPRHILDVKCSVCLARL